MTTLARLIQQNRIEQLLRLRRICTVCLRPDDECPGHKRDGLEAIV